MVSGDIGTSALYILKEVFSGHFGIQANHGGVLGIAQSVLLSVRMRLREASRCRYWLWKPGTVQRRLQMRSATTVLGSRSGGQRSARSNRR
ncbi:hypothetical protein [Pseudomonas sp. Z4-7]|uniref:hypothetical protein n=1 Tax=Pseudomonas sp. Z4-7 TaxID=2817413 RepID=UPI003DA92CEF